MQRDSGAEDPVAGGGGHVLALAPEGQGVDLADASAQLCLVRSGKWLGFWSPAGGGRFLQVRKRGLQKLCFFNANFGTWEQWEVVGREPPEGWGQADVCLANRRLPNFVISFTVLRVPEEAASHAALRPPALPEDSGERVPESSQRARVAASPSASASPPPARAGVGPSEAAAGPGGKHVMNAMSDMMVQEWTSFVTREVESRKYVERQLKLVSEGMQIIRTEVAGQVLDVRTRMRAEVKEAMLRCLVQQRRFWMAIRGHRIMRSAWRVWWKRVRSSRLVVSDARKFYLSYLVSKCLNAWVARCGKRRQVTNMARALVLRQTFSLRSATWEAWKCQVGIRQRYLRNFRAICQRADWFAVRSTFTAWWDRIIRSRRVRGVLRRMDSRLTFGRSSQAFNSWLQVCESAEAGRRLKMELLLKWKSPTKARLRSCFAFWAWHSAVQARRVRLLARAFASRIHRVLCKVFLNWGELVAQQAGQSFALAAHLEQTRAVVTARFFRAWSWAARYHSRLRSAMHRFALKSSRTWLRLAFLRWSEFVGDVMSVRAGAFKSARRCNVRRLSSALHSWQEEALRSRTERQTIYNVFRRMGAWRLRNFFRAWEQDARFQTSSRTFALRALHRWQRSRALRHCFYSLMAAAQKARTCRLQLMKVAKFCYQGITRRSFYGWAEAVEEAALERMQVLCLISRVSSVLSRFSFMYWREAVVKKRRQRLAVSRAKWKRGAACMHTVLKAWRIYSSTTNLSRKKVMRTALFRARSAAAASFDEWHAWVKRKNSERRALQQGRRRVNKVVLRAYFDRLVQVVHWKEKELTLFGCLGRKVEKIALKGAFDAWLAEVTYRASLRMKLKAFLGRFVKKWSFKFFSIWAIHVRTSRRGKAIAVRQWSKRATKLRSFAFETWRIAAADKACTRRLVTRSLKRAMRTKLCSAFGGWLAAVSAARYARDSLAKVARVAERYSLLTTFRAWAKQAATERHNLSVLAHTEVRARRECLCNTLFCWAVFTQEARRKRLLLAKAILRFHTTALRTGWLAFAENARVKAEGRHRAELCRRVIAIHSNTAMKEMAWQAWRGRIAARERSRVRMVKCAGKVRDITLRFIFHAWIAFIEDTRATRAHLKRVVTAKRLTKDWFISWYWSAYDDEIRKTLGMLYSDCESAAQIGAGGGGLLFNLPVTPDRGVVRTPKRNLGSASKSDVDGGFRTPPSSKPVGWGEAFDQLMSL